MRQQRDRIRGGIVELERVLDDPRCCRRRGASRSPTCSGPTRPAATPAVELPEPSDPVDAGYGHEPAVPFLPGTRWRRSTTRRSTATASLAPTPGSPFAYNGNGNGSPEPPSPAPWPSQLRTSVDDEQAPPANGYDANARPSEWGRPVFDRPDGDPPPFGR